MCDEQHERLVALAGGARNIAAETDFDDVLVLSVKDQGLADLDGVKVLFPGASTTLSAGSLRIVFASREDMNMAGKYHDLAGEILANVGGIDNVSSLTHCITRLRFKLKDEGKANKDVLENLDGVIQIMQAGGQYQVVVGAKVDDLYEELTGVFGVQGAGEVPEDDEPQGSEHETVIGKLMDVISSCMGPMLMPLAAAGMLKGLAAFFVSMGWMTDTNGIYQLMYAVGDGFFYFLPILLGYSASKKFGLNEFIGMALGAALVYPAMVNLTSGEALGTVFGGTPFELSYYSTFAGIPIVIPQSGYTSSVIPILLSTWVAAKFEKWLRKVLPEFVRAFLVPVCCFVVMVPFIYMVIGPVSSILTAGIAAIIGAGYGIPVIGPAFINMVVSFAFGYLVMFGLHWATVPIMITCINTLGFNPIVGTGLGGFANLGVIVAVCLRTHEAKIRALGVPAFIAQFCGVGEPCLYGILMPKKWLFHVGNVFAAIGGLLCGIFNVRQYIMGGMGFFSLPNFVDPATNDIYSMIAYGGIIVFMMIMGFVVTLLTYRDDGFYIGKRRLMS